MKISEEKILKEIQELRDQKRSCSQATLVGINRVINGDLSEKQLFSISAGFKGGIGCSFEKGPCGALSAGVMALGLFLPHEHDESSDRSRELFESFKKEYGTVSCGEIVEKHQHSQCTNCCLSVGKKVIELLDI